MTLQNNYTTTEQSKRLLELGVPADSADCYLTRFGTDEDWEVKVLNNVKYSEIAISNQEYCLPCWSVGRLMEIYHICIPNTSIYGWSYHEDVNGNYIEYIIQEYIDAYGEFDFQKLEEE